VDREQAILSHALADKDAQLQLQETRREVMTEPSSQFMKQPPQKSGKGGGGGGEAPTQTHVCACMRACFEIVNGTDIPCVGTKAGVGWGQVKDQVSGEGFSQQVQGKRQSLGECKVHSAAHHRV
jgi:hypothetical protein